MPYQFAGCVLIWNNGSLLSNEIWARVTVEYKRVVISYTRPLSTIAIIARRISLLFSVQSYCSFSLHLPGHRPADWHILCNKICPGNRVSPKTVGRCQPSFLTYFHWIGERADRILDAKKMIFLLVYLQGRKRKPVACKYQWCLHPDWLNAETKSFDWFIHFGRVNVFWIN